MSSQEFLEKTMIVHAFPQALILANEDIWNGPGGSGLTRGDVINMEHAHKIVFTIITNHLTTGQAYITVEGCSTAVPAATEAISFRYRNIKAPNTLGNVTECKGFTTIATSDEIYDIEVDAADLMACNSGAGYGYVRLVMSQVSDSAVDGAVMARLFRLRHAEDSHPTVVT